MAPDLVTVVAATHRAPIDRHRSRGWSTGHAHLESKRLDAIAARLNRIAMRQLHFNRRVLTVIQTAK